MEPFSLPGMNECKSPKAHHAQVLALPALQMGTSLPSFLLRIPANLDQTTRQSVTVKTKQHPVGPKQTSHRDGLKHSDNKQTLAWSAFGIPSESRMVCCCQCLQVSCCWASSMGWASLTPLYLLLPCRSIGCLFE